MFLGKLWFLPPLWFLGQPFLVPGKTLKYRNARESVHLVQESYLHDALQSENTTASVRARIQPNKGARIFNWDGRKRFHPPAMEGDFKVPDVDYVPAADTDGWVVVACAQHAYLMHLDSNFQSKFLFWWITRVQLHWHADLVRIISALNILGSNFTFSGSCFWMGLSGCSTKLRESR